MRNFRELRVWLASHNLTLEIYQVTKSFPKEELYGLTSQIRRSCASIPINIAEGCGKDSSNDYKRFLLIAMGSASELEYELQLVKDLGYLTVEDYIRINPLIIEVRKMLNRLIQKVKAGLANPDGQSLITNH